MARRRSGTGQVQRRGLLRACTSETLNSYGILSRPRVWRPENGAQGSTFPCRFIKARRESHHRSRRNPCTRAEAERNGEARRCSGVGRAPAAKGRAARQRHPMGTAARASEPRPLAGCGERRWKPIAYQADGCGSANHVRAGGQGDGKKVLDADAPGAATQRRAPAATARSPCKRAQRRNEKHQDQRSWRTITMRSSRPGMLFICSSPAPHRRCR